MHCWVSATHTGVHFQTEGESILPMQQTNETASLRPAPGTEVARATLALLPAAPRHEGWS